jgi:outer membrane murein-binding lipoprotein Lpp
VSRAGLIAVTLGLPLVAGCAPQEEIRAQIAEAQRLDCLAAGFEPDTDAFRLCLLIQDTNQRIAAVERRVDFLDSRAAFYPWSRRSWW